ncbi:MAG: MurT ligase domain-containing protein [Streptosporangiaceae bacterium]
MSWPLRLRLARQLGLLAGRASRRAGRGDGSVIGGRVVLAVAPEALRTLARGRRVALVSGTNGKTTTTRLVAAAMERACDGQLVGGQRSVASNASGANLPAGWVTALIEAPDATYAALEVDEKWLPYALRETRADVVSLLNLSRDQLDRSAETWMLADRWRTTLSTARVEVVANADDPLVAWAASTAERAVWVSVGQRWRWDSVCCPECANQLTRADADWRCEACGLRRPTPSWHLAGTRLQGPDCESVDLRLRLPGPANRANAAFAVATATVLGVPVSRALRGVGTVSSIAGRYRTVRRGHADVRLLLVKNPAGWLEVCDMLDAPPTPVAVALNARGPDGRDTSWLWDVDVDALRGRLVLVTGERALDVAVRLAAEDLPFRVVASLDEVVNHVPRGVVDVVANYTAFQTARAELDHAA